MKDALFSRRGIDVVIPKRSNIYIFSHMTFIFEVFLFHSILGHAASHQRQSRITRSARDQRSSAEIYTKIDEEEYTTVREMDPEKEWFDHVARSWSAKASPQELKELKLSLQTLLRAISEQFYTKPCVPFRDTAHQFDLSHSLLEYVHASFGISAAGESLISRVAFRGLGTLRESKIRRRPGCLALVDDLALPNIST